MINNEYLKIIPFFNQIECIQIKTNLLLILLLSYPKLKLLLIKKIDV